MCPLHFYPGSFDPVFLPGQDLGGSEVGFSSSNKRQQKTEPSITPLHSVTIFHTEATRSLTSSLRRSLRKDRMILQQYGLAVWRETIPTPLIRAGRRGGLVWGRKRGEKKNCFSLLLSVLSASVWHPIQRKVTVKSRNQKRLNSKRLTFDVGSGEGRRD